MFKSNSLLRSVNIICKLICLLIFITSLFIIKDSVLLLIISFLFFVFTHSFKYISKISLAATIVNIVSIFFPQLLWITKILLAIDYLCILSIIVNARNMKYLFELSFYRFKNRFLTKLTVTVIYFFSLMKKNWCKMDSVRKNYGLNSSKNYYFNLIKRVYRISKEELNEIVLFHELRLYNIKNYRTNIDNFSWERWDNTYLILHIFFLAIALFIGR